MSYTKTIIREHYSYIYKELWLLIGLNILSAIVLSQIQLNEFIQFGVVAILGWKSLAFYRESSLIPSSMNTNSNRFSWKYYQGLPISKSELLIGLSISEIISYVPLFSCLLSFLPQIAEAFFDVKEVTLENYLYIIYYSPVVLIITSAILRNIIVYPRRFFSAVNRKSMFFCSLRNLTYKVSAMVLAAFAIIYIERFTGIKLVSLLLKVIEEFFSLLATPWSLGVVLAIAAFNYYWTIQAWQDEKIGYFKNNWNAKRDVPIMLACLYAAYLPITQVQVGMYAGSDLNYAVKEGNYQMVESLLSKGHDINKANKDGFNPLMVAAHEGNYMMYKYLLSKGAKAEHSITSDDSHIGMNLFFVAVDGGNTEIIDDLLNQGHKITEVNPLTRSNVLHVAASNCRLDTINYLVEKGADINGLSNNKSTPMHVAARKDCLPGVALFMDLGANPDAKDVFKKIAIEYLKPRSREAQMVYYIQNKARKPAGSMK